MLIRVNGAPEQQLDQDYITGVANAVADKVEKAGFTVRRVQVPEPGKLPLQDIFDALALLLTPLGLLALLLSSFLVINTISALIAQQVRQIGVMKAIGARRYQIVGMYLGAVLLYSLAALAVAVPLTVAVAGGLASLSGWVHQCRFPPLVAAAHRTAGADRLGVLTPLLAALAPVIRGAGITVREAVTDYGTNAQQVREGWLTRLLNRLRSLPRPVQLSLRNTFRRRGRLALTLITLVLGGMLFHDRGQRALVAGRVDRVQSGLLQFDIQMQFERPYRTARVEQVARSLPERGHRRGVAGRAGAHACGLTAATATR
jgi:putative ABC transport system permease protein